MAIINQEFTIPIVANQSIQLLAPFNKRTEFLIQVQAVGTAWVSMTNPAFPGLGFRLSGWEIFGSPTALIDYVGSIFIYWEGDQVDPLTGESFTPNALVRVVELEK